MGQHESNAEALVVPATGALVFGGRDHITVASANRDGAGSKMAGTVRWGPKGQGFPFPEVGLSKTLHPADLDGSALSMGTGARHIPQD